MSHLIAKRAANRKISHFASEPVGEAPEGYVPHARPLLLSYGMPNSGFFPVKSISVDVPEFPFGDTIDGKPVIIEEHSKDDNLIDISRGLQYSMVNGIPQLVDFTKQFVTRTHKPKFKDWDITITNGAGDGLNKVADALLDAEDVVLVEEFTFTPFLQNVAYVGAIPVPIRLDLSCNSQGIDYDYLHNLLENWSNLKPGLRKPKALYTIPTGQNPTGLTQSIELRKRIYQLAEKYDFVIIEDDPYGYLTLPPYEKPEKSIDYSKILDIDDYLKNHLTPSYLTIDTVGRVVRIETFSKLFAPGLRLGFMVGHRDIIKVIVNYATIVTRSSSGTSQMLLNNIIVKKWGGIDGWLTWINKMRLAYFHRRNVLLESIIESKAYKLKYLEVLDPKAGMFVSVIINFSPNLDIEEKVKLLNWKFLAAGILTVPGINMAVDKEFSKKTGSFFRLSYAIANNDDELREAGARLAQAVYEFFENDFQF